MSLEKLMMKKKKEQGEMSPEYKNAKMSMLQSLKGEMGKMMGDDLKNNTMKKVEVASPDKEGLAEGLDKAKDMLGASLGDEDAQDADKDEAEESDSDDNKPMDADGAEQMIASMIGHESSEGELDDNKIDMLIELLQKKKMGMKV